MGLPQQRDLAGYNDRKATPRRHPTDRTVGADHERVPRTCLR